MRCFMIGLLTILTGLWLLGLIGLFTLIDSGSLYNVTYTGLEPLTRWGFEKTILGFPTRTSIAVYDKPDRHQVGKLTHPVDIKLNRLNANWLQVIGSGVVFDNNKKSEEAWVRRADISFQPTPSLKQAPANTVIQSMPREGMYTVTRFYKDRALYGMLLYGMNKEQPIVYAAVSCGEFSFKGRKLPNGPYVFGNTALFWQLRPYCWHSGKYQRSFAYIPQEFNPLFKKYLATAFCPFAFLMMLIGCIPGIFLLLIIRPDIIARDATPTLLAKCAWPLAIVTFAVVLFDAVCVYRGYHAEMSYCVATTVPLLFVCITHLTIIQMRMKELKRSPISSV